MTDAPTERGAEGIWTRLRRRKVVQWGLVYAAAAWGFLQGLEYVSDAFHWPDQLRQIALLALLIGLPIVLVLAYYHGDRGEQRISTPEFAILTLLLLLGGGAFWYYEHASDAGRKDHSAMAGASQPSSSPAISDARPSIAVLPFENRSDVQKDAFFVDGIHDDILTQLSKISALRVISRTSVERFRKSELSLQQIAQQLGVRSILEGGVQRAGDRVRINVQLIDAATDAHMWAETYDRELVAANIFAIQTELAAAIAEALKASLTPGERARAKLIPTQSLEAWEAYQLGKQRMANRTNAALTAAEEHFRRAIALDPKFALAWVGLSDTLGLQAFYGVRPKDSALDDAEQAVAKALELNPNLAEAWASSGMIAASRLKFEQSEQMLRRAVALNPNYATAHQWLSSTLSDLGRYDEALAAAERAVVLDPLSPVINNWVGGTRLNVGRFDDAMVAYKQAIEIDPAMSLPYGSLGIVYAYGLGRFDAAMPWYEKAASLDPRDADTRAELAFAHWHLEDDAEARRWLDRALAISEGTLNTTFVAALLYLYRGDEASALRHAQTAAELDPWTMYLLRDHDLRRGDYSAARARYAKAYPQLFASELPRLKQRDAFAAVELALVLQHTGEEERAQALLKRAEAEFQKIPRMGPLGYGFYDVAIHALRGETAVALTKLREAERAHCRVLWRYYRDIDPALASIRNTAEFKAVFADIERDMAQQRARLAARPKGAPLELTEASR